uniref:RNA-binding protein NOB1 n=1 Tax=Schistosoma japonicum TaxID=6182 RepID=Q5DE87_SCHJA|nr:SJCHGC06824 protein [Schistosoma japonicum]
MVLSDRTSHIVVDTAPFLKRTHLETFGANIYTIPQVIAEIKDVQTREYMNCLSYTLNYQVPENESINFIKDIAKQTGDISVLSATDISVIALTYDLHKKYIGEPKTKEVKPLPNNLGSLARCQVPKSDTESKQSVDEDDKEVETEQTETEANDTESSEPSDSDWITEDNFDERAITNFGLGGTFSDILEPISEVQTNVVACLTTDFAMQNVLLHAGLDIVSINGLRIRQPRTHLLWCCACFKPTKRMDTYFCPWCGHASLRRIPVTLHEDGQLEFHFAKKFVPRRRGLKQPVRIPKGGKYADEPIYCADQRIPDRRPARLKNPKVVPVATNGLLGFEDEELASILEFQCDLNNAASTAFPLNDITSRSALCGIRSDHQIPSRRFLQGLRAEHGLKPTRGKAHISKPRTGNKKKYKS